MAKQSRVGETKIETFEMLWSHLTNLYNDVESLAKRKQDGLMSKTRVSTVNQVLREILDFLKGQPSIKFLALLDDAMLPQNADALIFLGQYKSAMRNFMRQNSTGDDYSDGRKWKGTDRMVDD